MTEGLVGKEKTDPTPVDWEEMDRVDAEKRLESEEITSAAIGAVMLDETGIDRILAITDEEWELAQAVDDAVERAEQEEAGATS